MNWSLMFVDTLRREWTQAAIRQWQASTIKRAIRMAELGAREARITISGCVSRGAVEKAFTDAGVTYRPIDDDYIIMWDAVETTETDVWPKGEPAWETLVSWLRVCSSRVPAVDRVDAALACALQECMSKATFAARHQMASIYYNLSDRDVAPAQLVDAIRELGIQVTTFAVLLQMETAAGAVAKFHLEGWAS